ncbi:UV-endonuclease UvdE [Microthyrium microscopicum]|uniref:UV-endonuclease UvdE n=1 Tax=Microthyrium microscopicum TaxID=703497 RepID=A0A6A6TVU6_9PEZI|nr:UV-endonuclease UvdE [Microthyrium microscopicum]
MPPKRKLSDSAPLRATKQKTGSQDAIIVKANDTVLGAESLNVHAVPKRGGRKSSSKAHSNVDATIIKATETVAGAEPPNVDVKPKRGGRKSTLKALPKEDAAPLTDADAEYIAEEEDIKEEDIEQVKEAVTRPPPVHSDYLPLPWKGRLGYACLNTYLRTSNPPVFSSRTCRIASILEHRHPLTDPSQPEHATKNRPDRIQPADIKRGQTWVENLGLANARDIIKMVRWNDRYGIKFMRLSSEMFPFASHAEYGYKLAPFAADTLREAGQVIAKLGHRVTTHPGQYTQLGSPRKEVVVSAIRDLNYHDEMLSLLQLPEQQNRDAVMIIHMGGMFGSKEETLDRFRKSYAQLTPSVKRRLVLENDDVSWSVHDLLPICQELNIPMVLDFHHHNIVFDSSKIREGTEDIIKLFPEIRETWTRKGITQKMHYSEPTTAAVTPSQRRKHSPRVATLPPCVNDMDLMIEAKDKEQAVFELMRTFKLPGYDLFNNIIPYTRPDENPKPTARKVVEDDKLLQILEDDVGMGGPDRRVYWPPGMEEWLKPKKREPKSKESKAEQDLKEEDVEGQGTAAIATKPKRKPKQLKSKEPQVETAKEPKEEDLKGEEVASIATKPKPKQRGSSKAQAAVPTPPPSVGPREVMTARKSRRGARVSYQEREISD